ncbi:TetR/AcrR family transcriptional regulator [Nocardia sp. NBC_01503]|uniref:TetR/AcrR family transcriptional regulator n=1 Tax=Nocardia sp. NBC_01503 TaxID=2975997 RepID=UPI002E7B556B|nr:TetR/AcrR family transcriptional regulator [Nocardia sp. NBC_01503]WTL30397.1 TetR/AcrR family transcriptional regulator [Nocardia sp. NBC_01503]
MPRLVDHEQRRREITTAARRVIAAGGLEAATFQSVAAEAGISVRLIQYYFGAKRELLLATHLAVVVDSGERFAARVGTLGQDAGPREVIEAVALALLPLDDASHQDSLVLAAFHAAALSGSDVITPEDTHGAPLYLVNLFTAQLQRNRQPGKAFDTANLDAQLIVFALGSITQGVLIGSHTRGQVVELTRHLLDRMLGE